MQIATHQLYLATENNPAYLDRLAGRLPSGLAITEQPGQATLLLAAPPKAAPLLPAMPLLQWCQATFAGVDALMAPGLPRHYVLTNVRGVFGPAIAQYVFAHVLAECVQTGVYAQQQVQGRWQQTGHPLLQGKAMVVLGTGSIGRHLASVAKAFGMRTLGMNTHGQAVPEFDHCWPLEAMGEALAQAHVLVCTLPATPHTHHVLNQAALSKCQGALLINVGRGSNLCTEGLKAALAAGHVRGAVLDVFETEPLPKGHWLWAHPQVCVTPHIAAPSDPGVVCEVFLENLQRFLGGQPLAAQVDFTKGY